MMNLTANPFVRLILPFAFGVVLYEYPTPFIPTLFPGSVLFLCLAALFVATRWRFRYRWSFLYGLFLLFALALMGYMRAGAHDKRFTEKGLSLEKLATEEDAVVIVGVICDAPSTGKKIKTPFEIETIIGPSGDTLIGLSTKAMILWPIDSTAAQFRYGDRLLIRTRLSVVSPPLNPHAFDYRRYLHFQNIHLQAFADSGDAALLARGQGWRIWSMAFSTRDRLLQTLRKYFGEADEYAVASALLVGYKDDLSDEIKIAYAETGSMHALAVSGTHVGLLYMGLMLLLQRIPWSSKKKRTMDAFLVFMAIWAFAFLTGATASVLRATIMFSVFLIGQVAHRHSTVWNSLGVSAFGLLLFNPYFLFDPGFQLSYAAVAGMAFFYQRMLAASPYISNKWLREGYKVMLVGVAAQIGTLPLSLFYFHQFPTYFWLAGWVVVLGGAIFLWLGGFLLLLDGIWAWAASGLGKLLWGMIWLMNEAIVGIQGLPGSLITGVWMEAWEAALLYGIIGALAATLATRRKLWFWVMASGLALFFAHQGFVKIAALDQRKLFVYATPKTGRLIDFIDGRTVYAVADTGLTETSKRYICQSNRWALRASVGDSAETSFRRDFIGERCWYRYPIAQIDSTRLLWIDDPAVTEAIDEAVHFDIVVVSQSPQIDMRAVCERYSPEIVVFDATNSRKQVARLGAICAEAGVRVHDVRRVGWFEWGE